MGNRPAVLQFLGPSSGGIRRHVVELTARLREHGWAVHIAGPRGVLDGLGKQDYHVGVPSGFDPFALAAARRDLAVSARDVDLIHAHGLKAGWLAASLFFRPPLVATMHNVVLPELAGAVAPALRLLEEALPARTDSTVVVSREMARRLAGVVGAGRVTVVAPVAPAPCTTAAPSEVRASLGVPNGVPLVVSVGRLHPQKGHDTLVEAAAILSRRRPQVRVAIVGDGPSAGALARQVRRLQLDDVVILAGEHPSGADALAAADVVALASRWEGWPLVVAEAMQLGRPIVATAVGGIPEMLEDGRSGWLVAPGVPGALADALNAALGDPVAATCRAAAARADFEHRYPAGSLVEAVEDVYFDVLGRR